MGKRLNPDQRGRVAEKIMEWGNLVFAGLVIAQIVPGALALNIGLTLVGVACMTAAYGLAFRLMKGGE